MPRTVIITASLLRSQVEDPKPLIIFARTLSDSCRLAFADAKKTILSLQVGVNPTENGSSGVRNLGVGATSLEALVQSEHIKSVMDCKLVHCLYIEAAK